MHEQDIGLLSYYKIYNKLKRSQQNRRKKYLYFNKHFKEMDENRKKTYILTIFLSKMGFYYFFALMVPEPHVNYNRK